MRSSKRAILCALFPVWLLFVSGAGAAVRVAAEGVAPFTLLELPVEDTTPWYDAETWLRHMPGTLDWQPEQRRLTYQDGARQAALLADPPYALRDGQPLAQAPPTRIIAGRLAVAEPFLLERASDFLGRPVAVARAHGTGLLRVVLDPGHGGADPGARGSGSVAEKDVVLAVARDLAGKLRRRGFEPRITRQDDRSLDAAARAALANQWEADLFLSVHAAGTARPEARGFEVFVGPVPAAGADPRLWTNGQVGHAEESRRWAELVRRSLGESLATFDRGLQTLPSPLLEAVASPACLVELGNLAAPQEADTLMKPQGRAAVTESLAGAVEAFFRSAP